MIKTDENVKILLAFKIYEITRWTTLPLSYLHLKFYIRILAM